VFTTIPSLVLNVYFSIPRIENKTIATFMPLPSIYTHFHSFFSHTTTTHFLSTIHISSDSCVFSLSSTHNTHPHTYFWGISLSKVQKSCLRHQKTLWNPLITTLLRRTRNPFSSLKMWPQTLMRPRRRFLKKFFLAMLMLSICKGMALMARLTVRLSRKSCPWLIMRISSLISTVLPTVMPHQFSAQSPFQSFWQGGCVQVLAF